MNSVLTTNQAALPSTLPENFIIRYSITTTREECQARLALVTAEYQRRRYITAENLVDGLFLDRWEDFSTGYLGVIDDTPVASLRMVHRTLSGFPTESCVLNQPVPEVVGYEISQLVRAKNVPAQAALGILRCVVAHGKLFGNQRMVATADRHVYRLLTSLHIAMEQIGDAQVHVGSLSTPVLIYPPGVIAYLRSLPPNGQSNVYGITDLQLADFLEFGRDAGSEFEWYDGP